MTTRDAAKTLATLLALMLLLPMNVLITLAAFVVRVVATAAGSALGRSASTDPKTILVSGGKMTKALQLARSFHRAGHRVILVEDHRYWFTGHRYSTAVDRFHTLPPAGSPEYVDALVALIQRERVDAYVPVCSPAASLFDSRAMPILSRYCEVIHVGPDTIGNLDDKYQFAQAAESLNLLTPQSFLVTDAQQIIDFDFSDQTRPFILKSIRYDSVRRLDLTKLPMADPEKAAAYVRSLPLSIDNPWVMQEFISGTEYCTHGTLRNGELRVHCCCVSSAFQLNYEHVEKPEIEAWVRRFGAGLNLTGQASFDFIQAHDDGRIYAIECNPRTHSAITMFYNHPDLAQAYLKNQPLQSAIKPLPSSRPTYWIYHELWQLLTRLNSPAAVRERIKVIVQGKDAVFDWRDPLPFLMLHHWHVPLLLLRALREGRGWLKIDFNIGKLVQPGGD